jgi:alpha-D-xyloside xylohydrolase
LYNEAVFGLLEEFQGKGEAAVFARSATAGCQKFPVHWGGDCDATWTSMAETLRGGLSFGQSGGAFWSHDISGFNATATPALYKRWVAFGLLSSHSRLHGSHSYRVPWLFDEESVTVLRAFTELKHQLMPYLWRAAHEATETGVPMLRAMSLEFPDDPATFYLDQQYMLGGALLVAPVFNDAGNVRYYLPRGSWIDWFTGERVQGGTWREERAIGFSRIPLFVRGNTLLALGTRNDTPNYAFTRELALELCEIEDGATLQCVVHPPTSAERVRFTCSRRGARVTLRAEGLTGAGPSVGVRGGASTPWPDAARELTVELNR